jgi:hypothetical protein
MGAGASFPSSNGLGNVPESVRRHALELLNTVKTTTGKQRSNALKELWDLTDNNSYKVAFCSPDWDFLPTIVTVLNTSQSDVEAIHNATGCVWYLSREFLNRERMCDLELKLVPAMLRVATINDSIKGNVSRALSNCSLSEASHRGLLYPEFGYLNFLKREIVNNPNDGGCYQSAACVVGGMKPESISGVIIEDIHSIMFNKLLSFGSNPVKWPNRVNGVSYWCLNFVTWFSRYQEGAAALRRFPNFSFFYDLLRCPALEGMKATFVLANVFGSMEGNNETKSLLQQNSQILQMITDVFEATIAFDPNSREVKDLVSKGFAYGIFMIPDISSALRNLAISDSNKQSILKNKELLSYVFTAVKSFANNSDEYQNLSSLNIMDRAGGGGKDFFSIENFIELLLQLSFYYEDDAILITEFPKLFVNGNIVDLLEQITHLPTERNVPYETLQSASTLLGRLKPKPVVKAAITEAKSSEQTILSPSSHSGPRQHIMLSYAWAAKKNLVISLGKRLRDLGYDVWRDEEGSSIVPPMSGDIVETMAEAIQNSLVIVVCVSPEYKESANCRAEAKYARAREGRGGLKLIYVMMDENYHTKSSPRQVDGWLGFMVGTELWYPLWDGKFVDSTAKSISELIGDHAKAGPSAKPSGGETGELVMEKPTESVPPKIEQPQTPKDFKTAWTCLEAKKCQFPKAVEALLEELGAFSDAELESVEENHLRLLMEMLKPAPKKTFQKALHL